MSDEDDDLELNRLLSELKKELLENRSKQDPKELKKAYSTLLEKYEFKPGMLVTWKEGMRNKKSPRDGEPAIVVEVLEQPIYDQNEKSAGSPYFREPLDLVLGLFDRDGDFILYHYDSRRFRPYQENVIIDVKTIN